MNFVCLLYDWNDLSLLYWLGGVINIMDLIIYMVEKTRLVVFFDVILENLKLLMLSFHYFSYLYH